VENQRFQVPEHDIPQGGTGIDPLNLKEITMVRNILPLISLSLILSAGSAFAADSALTERITAAAEKACPLQVYDGAPKHLFYPITYKAEHETCVRLTVRSTLKQIAANGGFEQVAQK
jgi:hypothetical protein